MSQKLLTIGMATYDDYDGVYFTIQALRMYWPHLMKDIEFVIVDNAPTKPASGAIQDLVKNVQDATAKYVPFASPVGTSPSRNEIFRQATGEYVLAMDCHVLLYPTALESLLSYYSKNPKCDDLLQGPMFYDSMRSFTTHFNPVWRGEMWGVWSTAWRCKCSEPKKRTPFTFSFLEEGGRAVPCELNMSMDRVTSCPHCEKLVPTLPWGGHERAYEELGFERIIKDSDAPFEIPGQGLGLFSARRESWLGFHPLARAFGGEELCIHEKYRQAGRKALCLPALKWLHRFGRPGGVPYPIPRYQKIRSYVLWFQQLGLPLDPIYDHFVATALMGEQGWQNLIANPEPEAEPANSGCSTCGKGAVAASHPDIEVMFAEVEKKPRDLNEHMGTLRRYAAMCATVTEFTARRESTIAFLAARPGKVTSYSTETEGYTVRAVELVKDTTAWNKVAPYALGDIVPNLPETELLFVDTKHNFDQLWAELQAYHSKTTRFIIVHDTVSFGMVGEGGGAGLLAAIAKFTDEHPQWKIIRQHNHQYGLTILGCQESDYPQGPGTELHDILESIGIKPPLTCECFQRMTAMNDWGIDGSIAHRDEIIAWMRDGQVNWGWREKMLAAGKAITTGLAFNINWLDPFPGLVDLSIERTRAKLDLAPEDIEINEPDDSKEGDE